MPRAAITIVSRNYLHFARTLMQSVREHMPDWQRYVLIVDDDSEPVDERDLFTSVYLTEIELPDMHRFMFRYTILEANTAVKPWALSWLLDVVGFEQVVYFDPDIRLYAPPESVQARLDGGATMVLTPHLSAPLDDGLQPSDLDILKAGSYNLGFLALAKSTDTQRFLLWWQSKLEFHCLVDFEAGLFVDQKWLDLAPGMFGRVEIETDPGLNVAYWNLAHRQIESTEQGLRVNGSYRLSFFHFSGMDAKNLEPVSKHQNRFRYSELPTAVQSLFLDYTQALRDNGLDSQRGKPYHYGKFCDGVSVPDHVRKLYRSDEDIQAECGDDPFSASREWLLAPEQGVERTSPAISRLMFFCWRDVRELREMFPDLRGEGAQVFVDWFYREGVQKLTIPRELLPAPTTFLTERLSGKRSAVHVETLLGLSDGEFVIRAYQVLLGRFPDDEGYRYHRNRLAEGVERTRILLEMLASPEARGRRSTLRGLSRIALKEHLPKRLTSWWAFWRSEPAEHSRSASQQPIATTDQLQQSDELIAPAGSGTQQAPALPDCAFCLAPGVGFDGALPPSPEEPGLAWVVDWLACRTIAPSRQARLRVQGVHHSEGFSRAFGEPTLLVRVLVDGHWRAEFTLQYGGQFDQIVELDELDCEQAQTITLQPCRHFVPRDVGINDDPRSLSMQIMQLAWVGEDPLLDFSRLPSYHADPRIARRRARPGINLVGYLCANTGLAQGARLLSLAATRADVEVAHVDFDKIDPLTRTDQSLLGRLGTENPHPINICHVNADQFPLLWSSFGARFFSGRYNIGFWAWEQTEFPEQDTAAFARINEVWVPSGFVQSAISAKAPVPVLCMPHPVEFELAGPITRAEFGLPEQGMIFLSMYDLRSYQVRKNPAAAIRAFLRAFPSPGAALLVIKVHGGDSHPSDFRELQDSVAEHPHIHLLAEDLSRDAIYRLEAVSDVFLSLHRAEGFGLALAECMYLGKPVIATGWSGNMEFMRSDNSCCVNYQLTPLERDYGVYKAGHLWADPDIDHAVWFMHRLVREPDWRTRLGQAASERIRSDFSAQAIGARIRARLQRILS